MNSESEMAMEYPSSAPVDGIRQPAIKAPVNQRPVDSGLEAGFGPLYINPTYFNTSGGGPSNRGSATLPT